jgi:ABC-type transport system substrate-binding protein
MNVTQKPFDNPKVREAINYAINRQALVKVAFAGYATPRPAWCRRRLPTLKATAPGRTIRRKRASC